MLYHILKTLLHIYVVFTSKIGRLKLGVEAEVSLKVISPMRNNVICAPLEFKGGCCTIIIYLWSKLLLLGSVEFP